MSDDNSPNDYVGNHLFNGRGSNQNNHGGQNPNCGGGDRGGGHFAYDPQGTIRVIQI